MADSRRARLWLPLVLAVTAIGLASCGDDDGDESGTTTDAAEAETTAAGDGTGTAAEGGGEPILIRTHLTFLEQPKAGVGATGEVLPGSTLGDSDFCAGGRFSDRQGEPPLEAVVKTFRCQGGRLTITFSPTQPDPTKPSLGQHADWRVVNGSGRFEGFGGGGRMRAVFGSNNPDEGRETFTGAVTR
jgi:hypothetical protein